MNKSKSSISLRGLAHSLKQSINFDQNKAQKRQFIPLKSSYSTISLLNNNKQQQKKNQDNYLIMLQSRKSKFSPADAVNRNSNFSAITQKIKPSQPFQNLKEKLLQSTRMASLTRFPMTALPYENVKNVNTPQFSTSFNNILNNLYQQHKNLKIKLDKNLSTFSLKSYNVQLDQIDHLKQQLEQIQKKDKQFRQNQNHFTNRLCFLRQQLISQQMNLNQSIAQKQYCQQFLEKYSQEYQYKEEAKHVIEMIQKEYENQNLEKESVYLKKSLQRVQLEFKEWKVEENLELKQKRFENKFKQFRIELMKIEQDLDEITEQFIQKHKSQNLSEHGVRKVREYICAYFKRYNQLNINHISHTEIADGIDIFLCKQSLINQFTSFINQKTQKISLLNGIYSLKLTQYCDCLKKIQSMFSNKKTQINNLLSSKFQEKIIKLKQQIQKINLKRQKNQSKILELKQIIEKILSQETLATIECMNRNENMEFRTNKIDGFVNINQIKIKIKQLKIQQVKRIKKVRQIFNRRKVLQKRQESDWQESKKKDEQFVKQKNYLYGKINDWKRKIEQIEVIRRGFEAKKERLDKMITEGIQKMKQKDETQEAIRFVQKQIESLKKEKLLNLNTKYSNTRSTPDNLNIWNFSKGQLSSNLFNTGNKSLFKKSDYLHIQSRVNYPLMDTNLFNQNRINQLDVAQLEQPNTKNHIQQSQLLTPKQFQRTKKNMRCSLPKQQQNYQKVTQSSPNCLKQLSQYNNNRNILITRCNLVQSKSIPLKIQKMKGLQNCITNQKYKINNKVNRMEGLLTKQVIQSARGSSRIKSEKRTQKKNFSSKNSNKGKLSFNFQKGNKIELQFNKKNNMKLNNEDRIKQNYDLKDTQIKRTQRKNSMRRIQNKQNLNEGENTKKLSLKKDKSSIKLSKPQHQNINSIISNKLLKR